MAAKYIHVGGDGRGALLARPKSLNGALGEHRLSEILQKKSNRLQG
jgi:hypothetical protein